MQLCKMWGFALTKKIISNFERNMHIDTKIIFGYKQHRLKIDEEKKSIMTKKWTSPERESIADSVITCLEQNGYYWNDL